MEAAPFLIFGHADLQKLADFKGTHRPVAGDDPRLRRHRVDGRRGGDQVSLSAVDAIGG